MNATERAVGTSAAILARWVVLLALAVQATLGIAYGVPGHLSVDSVVQLYEGRTHQFISYHPPMMSLLLGAMDAVVPGAALFVLLDQALLTGALLLLWRGCRGGALIGVVLAAVVVLNPLLVAYTGVVWKDVLFAHLGLFGYACLMQAENTSARALRIVWSIPCLFALALAASLRQQGVLLAVPAIGYASFLLGRTLPQRLALVATGATIVFSINAAILATADLVAQGDPPPRASIGLRGLLFYDVVGIVAQGGALADAESTVDARSVAATFDIYRIDGLAPPPAESTLARRLETDPIGFWWRSLAMSPLAYTRHRLGHFAKLLGLGDTRRCLPIHVGVIDGLVHPYLQRDLVQELRLQRGVDARGQRLYDSFSPHFEGPLFRHWVWALLGMAATTLHFWRGSAALGWMGVGALGFAGSYAVISIACDFRYLYLLPVTATGLWFAVLAGALRPKAAPRRVAAARPLVASEST